MKIGIEKESLVFNQKLEALNFKAQEFKKGIELDFADHQIELITEPRTSVDQVYSELQQLTENEIFTNNYVWPLSIPKVKQQGISIVGTRTKTEREYRKLLAERYGYRKMMMSGIHLNFSNCEQNSKCCDCPENYHFELFKKLYVFAPLLMQFTSFSPFLSDPEPGLEKIGKNYGFKNAISLRNSLDYGFSNEQDLHLDYRDKESYFASIEQEIKSGKLDTKKELYSKLRFKGTHIELRFIDLNPYVKTGIEKEVIELIKQAVLYLSNFTLDNFDISESIKNFDIIATSGLDTTTNITVNGQHQSIKDHTINLFEMIIKHNQLEKAEAKTLNKLLSNYLNNKLPIHQMIKEYEDANYSNEEFGLRYLIHDQEYQVLYPNLKMELSTKILMAEANRHNLSVEVLDELTNFIEIKSADKSELIVQATKTNYDTYANILAMENKYITKVLLERNKIKVPQGYRITKGQAVDYQVFKKSMVVKPLDTNFGNGITILSKNPSPEQIDQAVALAFGFSDVVIIEEFVMGTEYRFLVINNETVSIVKRTPASILGDGIHTISELVAFKNSSSLRSKGYVTPLELINLGEFEKNFLEQQGYDVMDIPNSGEIVNLRKNSNVSTGGDSHEVFELIPEYFKQEAVKAAKALGVNICGVDMIIADLTKEDYSIIEANFNPAIQMHTYPYSGTGKNVAKAIIEMMFKI